MAALQKTKVTTSAKKVTTSAKKVTTFAKVENYYFDITKNTTPDGSGLLHLRGHQAAYTERHSDTYLHYVVKLS